MDSNRFDAWTRALATRQPRRQVLGTLAAATLAGALGRRGDAAGAAPCPAGTSPCRRAGGRIACIACPERAVLGARCRCLCETTGRPPVDGVCPCPDGLTDCGGICVDLATDMDNCGACGEVCQSDLVGVACIEGECVRVSCPVALPMSCGNPNRPVEEHCFDPMTDPRHCGSCDNRCASDQVCDGGICV